MDTEGNHIILFDGVCNLCNGTVQFLIERDSKAKFKFASLQSEKGQALLADFDLPASDFDTFVYIENGNCFTKSTAALRVLKKLGGTWRLFYIFIMLPKKVRDLLYNVVVRNRYKLFGKRDSCMAPTPELKDRFL